MMMTSVRRSRTSELHKLTHLWKEKSFFLFRLAEKQNGSGLGERTESRYDIICVVLGSTTVIAAVAIICM